jgi:phenylalanyl-tRNA synthetase beta chain
VKGDVENLLAPLQATFVAAEHPAMHPGRCAKVMVDGKEVGVIGELHPLWRQGYELPQAPVMFELDLAAVMQRDLPVAATLSKFQEVERDIAIIVRENVGHAALMAAIHAAPTHGLLQDALLFDVYRPKDAAAGMEQGEKSLAVRLTLGSLDATLTEEQIESCVAAVIAQLQSDVAGRLRA